MKRYLITYLVLFLSSIIYADFDKNEFLKKFNELNYKEKVQLIANTDFNDLKDIYPQIKDTLERIKKLVYTQTNSNEAKFLFDLIEAKESICGLISILNV